MSYNFSDAAIEIFTGINDVSTAPTASKAGNGSHLVNVHNKLVSQTVTALNVIESQLQALSSKDAIIDSQLTVITNKLNWKVINQNYDIHSGDKLLINNGGSLTINVPLSNETALVPGFWFELMKVDNTAISIGYAGIKIAGTAYTQVSLDTAQESISLIYLDENIGWIPSRKNILTLTNSDPYNG